MQTVNDQIATKDHVNGMQSFRYEDTISLQQYYAQTRPLDVIHLDAIHSYFVHSPWKIMVKHFTNQHNGDLMDWKGEQNVITENKKYITQYGFGVFHEHMRLSP
eukprot:906772_1